MTVATTTSLYQTGLEDTPETLSNGTVLKDDIKDVFQAQYPYITINFIAQATGAAIQTAERGDADMVLVHSPSQETGFLTGYGVNRKIVAYNFFEIVGPASDPAHINGMTSISVALQTIYNAAQTNSQVQWFSRNDSSGTNTAEIALWKAAGYTYNTIWQNTTWFQSTGLGMGPTLLEANNGVGSKAPGYTLTDTGTYLAYYDQGNHTAAGSDSSSTSSAKRVQRNS